jgi:hypothetical protein
MGIMGIMGIISTRCRLSCACAHARDRARETLYIGVITALTAHSLDRPYSRGNNSRLPGCLRQFRLARTHAGNHRGLYEH